MKPEPGRVYPFETCPKGTRWPWYPRLVGFVTAEQTDDGYALTTVGELVKRSVGIRLWIRRALKF